MANYKPAPKGWLTFGTLIEYDEDIEFSEELGDDLLPLWERPKPKE